MYPFKAESKCNRKCVFVKCDFHVGSAVYASTMDISFPFFFSTCSHSLFLQIKIISCSQKYHYLVEIDF